MRVDLNRIHALAETARTQMQAQRPQARNGRSWYRIENRGQNAEVYVYDMIGEWGVSAQDFVNELRGINATSVDLRVNSEGGEVFDGLAIFEAIARHPATFTAYIDGLAASAASFIVQAADKIIVAPHAKMMIHDANGLAYGPPRDLRAMADLLDQLSDTIADIYAGRAGGSRQQWRSAMQAASGGPDGTWYDAKGAVAAQLADEVAGADEAEDRAPLPRSTVGPLPTNDAPVPAPAAEQPGEWVWNPGDLSGLFHEIEAPPPAPLPSGAELLELFKTQ